MADSRPATRVRRLLLLVSMTATAVAFLAPTANAAPTVITVTKTAAPAEGSSVAPGSTITYTILIANGAGDIATGVSLTDGTPANTTYVADSATINGGAPIVGATNPFADGEPIPDIPASGSATATFQVTVNSPLTNGTVLTNTATVTATNADVGSDLDDVANHTVASAPSLSVAKTAAPAEGGTVNPADTITYTVVVTNQASATDTATGVSLTDATPPNTTYVPGSATLDGNPVADNPSAPLNPFEDGEALGSMAPNTSHTAVFRVTVSSPLPNNTPIANTATASATNNPNVSDGANHTVTSTPGLTVDKTAVPAEGGPVVPGATITYSMVVANDLAATETATGVNLTDATPSDTTYVPGSATSDDGSGAAAVADNPAEPLNPFEDGHDLGDMAPGDSYTLSFQVTVDTPLDNGTAITNTATASSDQGPDSTDDATHTVQSAPVLTLAKTSAPQEGGKVTPGTTISYTITVTNAVAATEKAKQLTLLDPAPANTTYVEGSAKLNGTALTGTGNPFGTAYALPDLAPSESATVTFDVKVASPLANGTVVSNLAKLSGDNHPDLEDGATHTVDSAAVLKVTLTSDPKAGSKVKAGDKIAYSLVVTNDAAATDSLLNVVVTAPTPEGTNYVEGSASVGGTPSQPSSRLAAPSSNPLSAGTSLGDLAPGATRTLDYAVEVRGSAGAIEGTVTVTATNISAVTATTSHRGPSSGSGGGGGGDDEDGSAFGLDSGSATSGGGSSELAFTGLDLARLLTLAFSLLLVGWTLLARGRSVQRRTVRVGAHDNETSTGFPAWDRWAGAWFFPDSKR